MKLDEQAGRLTSILIYIIAPAAAISAGCCKKTVCPRVPPPTQVMPIDDPGQTPPDARGRKVVVERTQQAASPEEVAAYSRTAEAVHTMARLLAWHRRISGERSFMSKIFAGRRRLISRRVLARLDAYMESLRSTGRTDELTAVRNLAAYLTVLYVKRETAGVEDRFFDLKARTSVSLPFAWAKVKTVPFPAMCGLIHGERNQKRRAGMLAARAKTAEEVLNPVMITWISKLHDTAQHMGFKSYFALSERIRGADVHKLANEGYAFMKAFDKTYRDLLAYAAKASLNEKVDSLHRADHAMITKAPRVSRFLPEDVVVEAFKHFLAGLGLDLGTASGGRIRIEKSKRAGAKPGAFCHAVQVPGDIRMSYKPGLGLGGWEAFFRAGGQAMHRAWTKEKRFELRVLGQASVNEAFGELFARVWSDPVWLARFGRWVQTTLRKGPNRRFLPAMRKADLVYVVRHRLMHELFLFRRDGWAKPVYESALHGAPPSVYKTFHPGPVSDRRKLYRSLCSRAYGFEIDPIASFNYLMDTDPFFASVDRSRAYQLADMMAEHLRSRFGADWYGSKQAGAFIKELWASGGNLTAAGLARKLGHDELSYKASTARLKRLLAEADKLAGGKPGPAGGKSRRPKVRCPGGEKPSPRGLCRIPVPRGKKGRK